jgi:selenide,water dikinase
MSFPDLLVGLQSPDDAAVWKLDENRDLIFTTDFFTPVVDDPYDYGSIAAANSLSDVYAMGGEPFLALNIVALPPDLPIEISREIIRGGAEKAREAGVIIAGGHTVQDKEPKFGLVVLGFVPHGRSLTKSAAKPGDHIFLTKPLGFGVTTTALKREQAEEKDVEQAVTWMKRLNRDASKLARNLNLICATDITGFGLLGHASEIVNSSKVQVNFDMKRISFINGAEKYAEMGTFPGGASDNKNYFGKQVKFSGQIDESHQMLLFDPQTSGGMLLFVPENLINSFKQLAEGLSQPIWEIGEVFQGSGIIVE